MRFKAFDSGPDAASVVPAFVRSLDAAAAALEQLGAYRVFQLPDLGAQHLLGDVDAPCRGGEARFLGDRHEVSQVPQLDVHRYEGA